jgi:signal transduction histidine kinase
VLFTYFLAREIREVRRQDTFIDSVTHELKSPLASLKLCLETLGRDNLGEDQRVKLRGMMLNDVDRLAAFIDDVLQASRLAHEAATINLSDVRLAELVRSCAAIVAVRHRLEDDVFHVDIDDSLVVTTDKFALEIVLKNLIDNAAKYSKDPVSVRISGKIDSGGRLVLEVADNGIGIGKKQLKRVFDRFYRVDDESVRRRRGTGLGLFVVSSLVRNLDGKVSAHSAGPGCGTTLRVILPRAASTGPGSVEQA